MIQVTHLTKKYGDHIAVNDLSFSIKKGEVYGFLGPNGAGKSTTMNIMTGCLAASGGEVKIDGYDIFDDADEAKKRIGYLPEIPPLYPDRTPKEYLQFVAEAKGISRNERAKQIEQAMAVTQIADVQDRLIKNLSKGYKQRVGIAQALLGNPEVIILDEPTVGLDPLQIIEIRDLIKRLGEKHTVILSSHILSEVQAVCSTIMIIAKGKLVACDTPENLEKIFAGVLTLELIVEGKENDVRRILSDIPAVEKIEIEAFGENQCRVLVEADAKDETGVCKEIFWKFANMGKAIIQMHSKKANLEDIFIELTSSDTTEKEDRDESSL